VLSLNDRVARTLSVGHSGTTIERTDANCGLRGIFHAMKAARALAPTTEFARRSVSGRCLGCDEAGFVGPSAASSDRPTQMQVRLSWVGKTRTSPPRRR
jgi:hypothetical protein